MTSQADESPRPGMVRVSLTEEQWRDLKVWAVREDTSVQALVSRILSESMEIKTPKART